MSFPCLVVDNGAGRIKFGRYSSAISSLDACMTSIPNCSAKIPKQMQILVGDEIDKVANGSVLQFSRPFDRGYLNNWPLEIEIWNKMFIMEGVTPSESSLIVTEAAFNPRPWQNDSNEIIYEYYGFQSLLRKPSPWFSSYYYKETNPLQSPDPSSCVVVDAGFSFTHIIPFHNSRAIKSEVRLTLIHVHTVTP